MRACEHTLTVDASVDAGGHLVGIGIVVQERSGSGGRGPIVERISESHQGIDVATAEEFAVLRALEFARERGFSRLKIRSDHNQMRRSLREAHRTNRAPVGPGLRRRILELAGGFEYVHFGWVPRRKNQLAHALARHGVQRGAAGVRNPKLATVSNCRVGRHPPSGWFDLV